MKKRISFILVFVLMCTVLFNLTACGGYDENVNELNAQITDLTKQISEANSKIATLEVEIASLKNAKASLEAEVKALDAEKDNLAEEKVILNARVSELEASIIAKNIEIAELKSNLDALESQKASLVAKNNAIAAENSELKKENEELKALVAAIRNCLKDIHTFSGGVCTTCGKESQTSTSDVYTRDGDYIYFGEYPQTIKDDDVIIYDIIDERGYYLGSDENYYAKITLESDIVGSKFSNGETAQAGSVYYFKVEPIRWRILSEENGNAFILCDFIIDLVVYQNSCIDSGNYFYYTDANGAPEGTYASNYKYSDVRVWLNSSFYQNAFNESESNIILTTEVDNSANSNNGSDSSACENTYDKIFLLSYSEVTNSNYGFTAENTNYLEKQFSDFSSSRHSYSRGLGLWILRSPAGSFVYYVNDSINNIMHNFANVDGMHGIVPAMWIQL